MNNNYEKEFHQEVERILKEVYFHQKKCKTEARAMIHGARQHLHYLHELGIITITQPPTGDIYPVLLNTIGYEVFEKYNGWFDYKKKVIDRQEKIDNAKGLAQRFWWIPVAISVVALIVSVISLIKNA